MYKLKPEIDYHQFFKQISKCSRDVIFETPNGDRINLGSLFCRFVFISLASDKENLRNGTLVFAEEDLPILKDYVD